MTLTPAQQLQSQLRKYFLTVIALIGGGLAFVAVTAVVLKISGMNDKAMAIATAAVGFLTMFGVLGCSFYACHRLWRCPACDKFIYWTVSWNVSAFSRAASPNCPGCGVELFTRKAQRRTVWIIVLLALGFFAVGAATSAARVRRAPITHVAP